MALAAVWSGCAASESPAPAQPAGPPPAPTFELAPPEGSLPPELASLVSALDAKNERLVATAEQLAASGHANAIARGSRRLVEVATDVGSPAWRDRRRADVRESNADDGIAATDAQLEMQLDRLQTKALGPVFLAMEALGGADAVAYALQVASNKAVVPERRSMAFGVLAKHVPEGDPRAAQVDAAGRDIERLLAATNQAGATMAGAMEVVARLRPDLRSCYDEALAKDPQLDVKGTLLLKVDPSGAVAESKSTDLQPPDLATCVEKVGSQAKFEANESGTTLRVPIVFQSN